MAHILVTGGCGFIGSHLVNLHLLKGDDVWVVDDLSAGSLDNLAIHQSNPHLTVEKTSILNWSSLNSAVKWADCIYHLAAIVGVFKVLQNPCEVIETNIFGCKILLDALIKNESKARFILISSSSVYGPSRTTELKEDDDLTVRFKGYSLSTYAVSKVTQESILLGYYQQYQIPMTIVRLFNVFGERQIGRYGMVVPRFIEQACENKPITVFGDGTQLRSFCAVSDAVYCLYQLALADSTIGEIVNVGNESPISINNLAKTIKQLANSDSQIEYYPYESIYGKGFRDTYQRRPNIEKLFQLIGFKPSSNFEETLSSLINSYRAKK